jgi:hypothetical protein
MKTLFVALSVFLSFCASAENIDCADMQAGQVHSVMEQLDSCHISYDAESFDGLTKAMYQRGFKAVFYNTHVSRAAARLVLGLSDVKDPGGCMDMSQAIDTINSSATSVKKTCNFMHF